MLNLHDIAYIVSFGEYRRNFVFLVFFVTVLFFLSKKRKEAFYIFLSSLSYFYSLALKFLFHRQRPSTDDVRSILDIYSFPSSHVVIYVCFFGFIIYLLLTKRLVNKALSYFFILILSFLILLVGWSRIYLNAHYFIDVLMGYFYGLLYLCLVIYLYKYIGNSVAKNKNENN